MTDDMAKRLRNPDNPCWYELMLEAADVIEALQKRADYLEGQNTSLVCQFHDQFEHIESLRQRVGELEEENKRLRAHDQQSKDEIDGTA